MVLLITIVLEAVAAMYALVIEDEMQVSDDQAAMVAEEVDPTASGSGMLPKQPAVAPPATLVRVPKAHHINYQFNALCSMITHVTNLYI